jgi:hypothetical protein
LTKESPHVTPRTLDDINVVSGVRNYERNGVIYGALLVTQRPDIPVCIPGFADERSAVFDPGTDDIRHCVGVSVRYGNKKCPTGLAFHTAKHPLALNRVSLTVFSPTELAVVDLNSLVRITDARKPRVSVTSET